MTDAWAVAASDAAAFGRRAAALAATSSEHLPRVLDVTVLGERRELQLQAVSGPVLVEVLASRGRLPLGEAVTIVISAARAVAALHSAGFCGVSLGAETIRFDSAGTPMILGLDDVREIVRAGAQGPGDDWRAVGELADRLGLIVHGRAAGALGPAHVGLGLALATLTAGESEQAIDGLDAALFELADPQAVRLDGAPPAHLEPAAAQLTARRAQAAHRRPSGSVLIEAFDAGPAALLAGPMRRARERTTEALSRVHGRARLLLVAGAAAAALTVAAIVLLPGEASPRAVPPSAAELTTPSAAAPMKSGDAATTAHGAALSGADPVAAASALLADRDECLALRGDARAGCLARVADGQGTALDQPARPLATLTPSLLELTGDSALIALTPKDPGTAPASALLMRTEAGWKLRQLYEN